MTFSAGTLDVDALRTWIGREEHSSDVVTVELVRRFNATFGLPAGMPQVGDAAPPLIHFCLAPLVVPTGELGPDGHPHKGGFLPPVPLPRRMWAGGELNLVGALKVGDAVQRLSRISDVVAKNGQSGPLCFVTVEHVVQVDRVAVIRERQDIVYRGLDVSRPRTEAAAAAAGERQRSVEVSAPLLFRYSALTFNGHRIHYDRTYSAEVEGYPGLVVHGPLQATMLLQFAMSLREGASPARFRFRSLSPLFDDEQFDLHASEDGPAWKLWTARRSGLMAMLAEAEWS